MSKRVTIWLPPSVLSRATSLVSFVDFSRLHSFSTNEEVFPSTDSVRAQSISLDSSRTSETPALAFSTLNRGNAVVKFGCLAITNECVHALSVLAKINSRIVGQVGHRAVYYKQLTERFSLRKEDSFGEFVINEVYTDLHKLVKDVNTLIKVLVEVGQEITVFGGITTLNLYMESVERMERDEEELFQELEEEQERLRQLEERCRNSVKEHQKKCHEMDILSREFIGGIKDDLEKTDAERKFTKLWENARKEQNSLKLKKAEENYKKTIRNVDTKIEEEERCHREMEKYLLESTEDYSNAVQDWMDLFDKDLEEKENSIYRMKIKVEEMKTKTEEFQQRYEMRAQEMEDWLEHKRKRAEERKRQVLMVEAAIKIQAWWRIIMFRKKLGPYRKKTKKDRKGGKKKQNKIGKRRK